MVEPSVRSAATWGVIVFPVESPATAIIWPDISAREFLRRVVDVQRHWVLAGEAPNGRSPGLHHGISHTCVVREDEWPEVAEFVWQHRSELRASRSWMKVGRGAVEWSSLSPRRLFPRRPAP